MNHSSHYHQRLLRSPILSNDADEVVSSYWYRRSYSASSNYQGKMAQQAANHCRSVGVCGDCLSDQCQWSPSATHLLGYRSWFELRTHSARLSQSSCSRFRLDFDSGLLARESRNSQALNESRWQASDQVRCWWTTDSFGRPGKRSLSLSLDWTTLFDWCYSGSICHFEIVWDPSIAESIL